MAARRREMGMQMLQDGVRGLHLLVQVNGDRLLMLGAILISLMAGAWLGEALLVPL